MQLTYICLWIFTNLLLILMSYCPISNLPTTSVSHLSYVCYLFHHFSYSLTQYAVPNIHALGFHHQQPSSEGMSNVNVNILPTISSHLDMPSCVNSSILPMSRLDIYIPAPVHYRCKYSQSATDKGCIGSDMNLCNLILLSMILQLEYGVNKDH